MRKHTDQLGSAGQHQQDPPPSLPEHPAGFPITIHDLTVAYDRKPVLWDVELNLPEGKLIGVIGPNGAGKSTLLKACLGLIPISSGQVRFYGKPYSSRRDIIAYVPQRESVDWDFPASALDVVTMGIYRKIGWLRRIRKKHHQLAMGALDQVGISHLAHRQIGQLSGGQQQRVFLARALVQDARIYLMDEPFAGVDAATEEAIISLLRGLRNAGQTCLVVHHDLATVARYFDHIVLINMRIVADGPTATTFNTENLQKTYGGKLSILDYAAEALRASGH
jgi:manganese/zinc/iron transport system ATP- binding protein